MDTEEILEKIEDELGVDADEWSRGRARMAIQNSYLKVTPARRFYERYNDAEDEERQRLFDDWRVRFLTRASGNPNDAKVRRRFKQYLRLGANSRSTRARKAARQNFIASGGGVRSIQELLGKPRDKNMPEYLWVTVYVTRIEPVSARCFDFAEVDERANLMVPMVYIGHRRDSKAKRDSVRISDARRRGTSDNGLTQITRHLLDSGLQYPADFRFEEIWNLEVLGMVDHGMGLEASNAVDASVIEDLKRIEVIEAFLAGDGPRPLNSKIDNALLGVTNIKGLLRDHDTPADALDEPRINKKLEKAKNKLQAKYREYTRRFIKDETGDPVLPILEVTKDGIGQVRSAQFSAARRKRILGDMEE